MVLWVRVEADFHAIHAPVFNLDGEVIGITFAITSPSGVSSGITFALPSNCAKVVVDELIKKVKYNEAI